MLPTIASSPALTRCVITIAFAFASGARSVGQPEIDLAEQEFATLEVAARPIPIPPPSPGTKKTRDDFLRDQKAQSAGFVAAAEKARAFHAKHPKHPKASAAKKIEVISLMRAVNTGSTEVEPQALRLAREYRADSSHPSKDRYEVAMTVTQIGVLRKKIKDQKDLMNEYYQRALDLYGEFPSEPAIFELFLGVARNADTATARKAANQILGSPAPARIKEQAQTVIERLDLPGKAANFEWQDESGNFHKISDYKGKVVVFYVWATWTEASEMTHETVAAALNAGVTLVSVNLDKQLDKGKGAKAKVPAGAIHYFDDRGVDGPLARQLKVAQVPSVHVVNARGIYVGSGSPDELSALLGQAGK